MTTNAHERLHGLRPQCGEPGTPRALEMQVLDVQLVDHVERFEGEFEDDRQGEMFAEVLESSAAQNRYDERACYALVFGCTADGRSAMVIVDGFKPYLYFDACGGRASHLASIAKIARVRVDALESTLVLRKNLYGFVPNDDGTDLRAHRYMKVCFPTVASYRRVAKYPPKNCHEHIVPPETKFLEAAGVTASGWMRCTQLQPSRARVSNCAIEGACQLRQLAPLQEVKSAPLLIACVDIECPGATGNFPSAETDAIFQIGLVFWRLGASPTSVARYILVVGKCAPIDDTTVLEFATERELLCAFRRLVAIEADPDVIATYNGFNFDWKYMVRRAELLRCDEFLYLDRIITRKCRAGSKELSSSALGKNELFVVQMCGRVNLDICKWLINSPGVKRSTYRLGDVTRDVLPKAYHKQDFDHSVGYTLATGTPDQVAHMADYCVQDCYALVGLLGHYKIVAQNIGLSRVVHTLPELLVTRGQQVRVVNMLHWECNVVRDASYVMNMPASFCGRADDKYQGATVLPAMADYYKDPVAVLDFMSLYPSIIIANNFCYSTVVLDPAFEGLPNITYKTIVDSEGNRYVWAKNFPGVIPDIAKKLLAARKHTKRLMADATDPVEIDGYNSLQNAMKVAVNSIYGFSGAVSMGCYPNLALAASVTYMARHMLMETVRLVKEYTDCEVVYGDTVKRGPTCLLTPRRDMTGAVPHTQDSVMVRFNGISDIEAAFDLGDRAAEFITAQFPDNVILEMEKVKWFAPQRPISSWIDRVLRCSRCTRRIC